MSAVRHASGRGPRSLTEGVSHGQFCSHAQCPMTRRLAGRQGGCSGSDLFRLRRDLARSRSQSLPAGRDFCMFWLSKWEIVGSGLRENGFCKVPNSKAPRGGPMVLCCPCGGSSRSEGAPHFVGLNTDAMTAFRAIAQDFGSGLDFVTKTVHFS